MTNDPSTPSRRRFMRWLGGGAVGAAAVAASTVAGGRAEATGQPRTLAERLRKVHREIGSAPGVQRGPVSMAVPPNSSRPQAKRGRS